MTLIRLRHCLAVLAMASTTACGVIEPCQVSADVNMDGSWKVALYNGLPIPANGALLPGTSDRLKAGTAYFKTATITDCKDDVGRVSSGNMVLNYEYIDNVNGLPRTDFRAATFIYDNETGALTISAAGRTASGDRTADEFTLQQYFGTTTYTVTFTRLTYH